jgi:hypothetical protein
MHVSDNYVIFYLILKLYLHVCEMGGVFRSLNISNAVSVPLPGPAWVVYVT